MKVVIDVFDVFTEFSAIAPPVDVHSRLMFSMIFPCDSNYEAASLIDFAENKFDLAKEYCSNWHAGIRMGYLGLKSAYWFDGYRVDIKARIEE